MKKLTLILFSILLTNSLAWAQCPSTCSGTNTFLGQNSGIANTSGVENAFFGRNAGRDNTGGSFNAFFGEQAGQSNTTGQSNTFFGEGAGLSNTTGSLNTFIGRSAGRSNATGRLNTYIGWDAGLFREGDDNTFIGARAGFNSAGLVSGNRNTYIGSGAGEVSVSSGDVGSGNVFIGYNTGKGHLVSDKLFIDNSDTSSPLILGDFESNTLTVNGALGVGIENPERPIHLRATNAIFRIDRDRDDPGFAIVRYDQGFQNVFKSFYFYTRARGENDGKFIIADWGQQVSGPSTPRLVIANDGNVGIGNFLFSDPSQKLTVDGNVIATNYFVFSDKRLKQNVEAIPAAMERLNSIQGVSYGFQADKFENRTLPQGQQLGLIAQEVEKVFPELIVEDNEGFKAVNYNGMIPVLVQALKEQQAEITNLKAELEALKAAPGTEAEALVPAQLYQNRPNPFDQNTQIKMYLPEQVQTATLYIYNMQGQTLKQIQVSERGETEVEISGSTLKSGMYLYALIADNEEIDVKRMILK